MPTKVYISVSDEQKQLTVDGSLELLRQLMSVLPRSEESKPADTPTQDRPAKTQEKHHT